MNNPKVSIVIPVHNGANYLREAIKSALAQTYENIEILVINDGSTDDGATEKIAESFGSKIKYYEKENGGVATALNLGIQKMTGEYFSWLSHDDLYEKNKIKEQIKTVNKYKEKNVIVASNSYMLYSNGIKERSRINEAAFNFFDIFLATSASVGVNGCSLLIPRSSLLIAGGFNANLPVTQDYDLWFRLKNDNRFVLNDKYLVVYRLHDEQDSVQKQKICIEAGDKLHYDFIDSIGYERFKEYFGESASNIDHFLSNYYIYRDGGYKKTSSMMLKKILEYYRDNDAEKYRKMFSSEIGTAINIVTDTKERRTKVAFYSNVWHRGGIERVLSYIFNNLGDKYELLLICNDDNIDENLGYDIPNNVSYVKTNNRNQIIEILNILALFDIDIFIGNPNFSSTFIDIYPALKDTKVKTIAYNHGYYFLPYMAGDYLYPTALKIKNSYMNADRVIWLSRIACKIYNIENNNGVYLPDPVELIEGRKPKTNAIKNILAVGRFDDEIKRIDNILLTFKELVKIDQNYKLDVVGYCPMELKLPWRDDINLRDFIENEKIPVKNIKFWGIRKDISKFYNKAGFLLMASKCEGFAMVLVEALSHGVPCVCSEYIGVEEIVEHGLNGWVVPQCGFIEAAKLIDETIKDKKRYVEMSKYSLESVKKYDINLFLGNWIELLDDITRNDLPPKTKSIGELSTSEYKRILMEYEGLLNDAARNSIAKLQQANPVNDENIKINRYINKLIISTKRDGLLLTAEKIVRKVYRKLLRF